MTSDHMQPRGDARPNRTLRPSAVLLAPRESQVLGGLLRAAPIAAALWLAVAGVVAILT